MDLSILSAFDGITKYLSGISAVLTTDKANNINICL